MTFQANRGNAKERKCEKEPQRRAVKQPDDDEVNGPFSGLERRVPQGIRTALPLRGKVNNTQIDLFSAPNNLLAKKSSTMTPFLMHVGHKNTIDLKWTVARKRSIAELVSSLPAGSERDFFAHDEQLKVSFPSGEFNCWGVPELAEPAFMKTDVGDLVLFAPHIGIHDGGIRYLGVVKAIPRGRFPQASRILWPETPDQRLFPWLFFFEAEEGFLCWYEFLRDAGYKEAWNPKGWYRYLKTASFSEYSGCAGYLEHLRREKQFKKRG